MWADLCSLNTCGSLGINYSNKCQLLETIGDFFFAIFLWNIKCQCNGVISVA